MQWDNHRLAQNQRKQCERHLEDCLRTFGPHACDVSVYVTCRVAIRQVRIACGAVVTWERIFNRYGLNKSQQDLNAPLYCYGFCTYYFSSE